MSGVQDQLGRYAEPRIPLIDPNVYAALVLQEHKGHATAQRWLARQPQIATCPMVELAVLRLLMRPIEAGGCGLSAGKARSVVVRFKQVTSVKLIPEDVEASGDALPWRHVLGHNQVNDAYLLALARIHQLRVCTFDRGFMSLFPGSSSESVELLAYDAG
jgi:toxin-antitoxin system PIN domain toxin